MTVRRGYVECATCAEKYTLRIGEGSENYQKFYFDCFGCKLPITIAYRNDLIDIEAIENCKIGTQEGKIVNLYASLGIDENKIHDDQYFPTLEYLQKVAPFIVDRYKSQKSGLAKMIDAGVVFELINTKDMWLRVKNIINSESNKNIYKNLIAHYSSERKKYEEIEGLNNYQDVVLDFFSRIFYPKFDNLYKPCLNEFSKAEKEYKAEFLRFKMHFQEEFKKEYLSSSLIVFDDFFKFYENFSQLLFHTRISDYNVKSIIVSSKNFNEVNKFYGQVYEALTSSFTILACVNNILENRKFDQFKTMSLKKYLDIKKGDRAKTFQERQAFYVCSKHIDAPLRNGINHASFYHKGEKVIYKSSDNKQPKEMTYSEYVMKCNELTVRLSVLFCLGMLLV